MADPCEGSIFVGFCYTCLGLKIKCEAKSSKTSRRRTQTQAPSRPPKRIVVRRHSTSLSDDGEAFLSTIPEVSLHGSAAVPLVDLQACRDHTVALEFGYRKACSDRTTAASAFQDACAHADLAYELRNQALSSYLKLVEKLAVEKGGFPAVAGHSQSSTSGNYGVQEGSSFKGKSAAVSVRSPSVKGKGKEIPIIITEGSGGSDEEGVEDGSDVDMS